MKASSRVRIARVGYAPSERLPDLHWRIFAPEGKEDDREFYYATESVLPLGISRVSLDEIFDSYQPSMWPPCHRLKIPNPLDGTEFALDLWYVKWVVSQDVTRG